MNIHKILYSPLINKAALARHIWPDAKDAKVRLAHKMQGKNGRSLTEQENERILEAVQDLCQCDDKPEVQCDCGWVGMLAELEIATSRNADYDICPKCKTGDGLENLND